MNVRKAVGAVVFQNDEYLLVHKVKSIVSNIHIEGQWDFPKGGIQETDRDLKTSILRELKEETGSTNYKIIKQFTRQISFSFPKTHKYDKQETIMFYVEYLGDKSDLKPLDDEVGEIKFFSKCELLNVIKLEETCEFLKEGFLEV